MFSTKRSTLIHSISERLAASYLKCKNNRLLGKQLEYRNPTPFIEIAGGATNIFLVFLTTMPLGLTRPI